MHVSHPFAKVRYFSNSNFQFQQKNIHDLLDFTSKKSYCALIVLWVNLGHAEVIKLPIPVSGGWAVLAGWLGTAFAPIAVAGVGSGLVYWRQEEHGHKSHLFISFFVFVFFI